MGVELIFNGNGDDQAAAAADHADITYCIGLWLVPGNKKRSRDHYLTYLPKTLELLKNRKVVFLYDDDSILDFVRGRIETDCFFAKKVQVNELAAHPHVDQLIASAKKFKIVEFGRLKAEKGLIHYKRDLMGSGEQAYKTILAVWLSKIFVVHDVATKENPFNSSAFAWVDASISRFPNVAGSQAFSDILASDKILMRGSGMRYKGRQIQFNASFILATTDNWRLLYRLYSDELSRALHEAYPNDEETLLHKISQKHRHLFGKIKPGREDQKSISSFIRRKVLDAYYATIYFFVVRISKVRD